MPRQLVEADKRGGAARTYCVDMGRHALAARLTRSGAAGKR